MEAGVIESLNATAGDIVLVGSKLVNYKIVGSVDTSEPKVDDAPPDTGCVVGAVDDSMSVPASFQRAPALSEQASNKKSIATPAVRRIAGEHNINIDSVVGTGRGGRVTASDIESHATTTKPVQTIPSAPAIEQSPTAPLATRVSVPQEGVSERIPFRGIRRKIAEAMTHSLQKAAHFQVIDEADVTILNKKRKALSELIGKKTQHASSCHDCCHKSVKKTPYDELHG